MAKITIWSDDECTPCRELEEELRRRGVQFKVKKVRENIEEAMSKGIMGKDGTAILPTIEICNLRITGYDDGLPSRLEMYSKLDCAEVELLEKIRNSRDGSTRNL